MKHDESIVGHVFRAFGQCGTVLERVERECEHEMYQTLGKHVGEDVRVLGLLRTGTL